MITETTTALIQQGRATEVQSAKRLIEISRLEDIIGAMREALKDCRECLVVTHGAKINGPMITCIDAALKASEHA